MNKNKNENEIESKNEHEDMWEKIIEKISK